MTLTFDVYEDDFIEPLSPNHLIHGRAVATRGEDIANIKETEVRVWSLNQSYKYIQFLMETFWTRWSDEYFKELREQRRIIFRTKNIGEVHVNDVYLYTIRKLLDLNGKFYSWLKETAVEYVEQ